MDVIPALRVGVALLLVFVVLPRVLFGPPKMAKGSLDRLVIDVVRISAFLAAVVPLLAALHLFEWTGFLLVGTATIVWCRVLHGDASLNRITREGNVAVVAALYIVEAFSREGAVHVKRQVTAWAKRSVNRIPRRPRLGTAGLVLSLPLAIVLVASLVLRLWFPMTHSALAPSDQYVHLAWIKSLASNVVFADGIYPLGLHSALATMAKVLPVTSYDAIRFAGPFINVFVVFVIYILALRASQNPGAALAVAGVVGLLATREGMGVTDFRQSATLPQEFSVLLALLGLWLALDYIQKPERSRLLLVAAAAGAAASTHVLGAAVAMMLMGACGATSLVIGRYRSAFKLLGATAAGVAVGHSYVLLGFLSGENVFSGVSKLNPVGNYTSTQKIDLIPLVSTGAIFAFSAFGAAVALGYAMLRIRAGRRDSRTIALTATSTAVLLALGVQATGDLVLYKWYAVRWTESIAPLAPLGIALALAPVASLFRRLEPMRRSAVQLGMGVATTAGVLALMPPALAAPKEYQTEYEVAARVTSAIVSQHSRLSFTVVGTPETYDRVLGEGFHVQLSDFADNLSLHDATDPSFSLPIPTLYTYVLVEKRPFVRTQAANISGNAAYLVPQQRADLMEEVSDWMDAYAKYHDNAEVVFEDADIKLWKIKGYENTAYVELSDLLA